MRPLTFITGVIFGSAVSISLGLAVVGLIFAILAPEYPRIQPEIRPYLASAALFFVLTAASGLSFIGLLRERPWRWVAQAAMWAGLAGTVWYYLPG